MVVNAMKAFNRSCRELESRKIPGEWSLSLDGCYQENCLPRLAQLIEGQPIANLYKPNAAASQSLQYHCIANHSNPVLGHLEY